MAMPVSLMTAAEAFYRLQDADKIWQTISKGAKGRDMRAAWQAREVALRIYHAAVTQEVSYGKRDRY